MILRLLFSIVVCLHIHTYPLNSCQFFQLYNDYIWQKWPAKHSLIPTYTESLLVRVLPINRVYYLSLLHFYQIPDKKKLLKEGMAWVL